MQTRLMAFCAAMLTLAACGEDEPDAGQPKPVAIASCATAGASYVVSYVQRSGGTCGPVPDQVINTSPEGTVSTNSACTGANRTDGCDVFIENLVCPGTDPTTKVTSNGKVTWQPDGSSGQGTVQISIATQNDGSCVSSYDVTYRRQ